MQSPPADDLLDMIDGAGPSTPDDRLSADMRRRMSPVMIDSILRSANMGDPRDVADLHNAMIGTWPRLAKNIGTIRRAAAAAPWPIHPWKDADGESPTEAADRRDTVERALRGACPSPGSLEADFTDIVAAFAEDAVRGTGVAEMLWHTRDDGDGPMTAIRAFRRTHPNYYAWPHTATAAGGSSKSGDRLLFRRGGIRTSGLEPWPENQFAVLLAPSWNNHPAMASTLSVLSVAWIAANYGPQWLFDYAQQFGLPFTYANFPQGDTRARDTVYAMLRNLSGKRYAAFPEGTNIHLVEAGKAAGDLPQKMIIEMADTICDILLLGQTLTTETGGTGSQALGNVHAGVANDVLCGILTSVAKVINTQIIPAILRLNYGDTRFAPCIHHGIDEPEDETAKATRDQILLTAGVALPRTWLYDRHKIPVPAEGEALISGVEILPTPPTQANPAPAKAAAAPIPDDQLDTLAAVFERTIESAVAIAIKDQPSPSDPDDEPAA